jgi:SAM-dependent methyltransferase
MADIYLDYAQLYLKTGQGRFSLRLLSYVLDLITTQRLKGKRVLDIGCGTGNNAVALARRGFEVTGIDINPSMLAIAQTKQQHWSKDRSLKLNFYQQSILAPPTSTPKSTTKYDLVLSFYDVWNHFLIREDWLKGFEFVKGCLSSQGHFIFDVVSLHGAKQVSDLDETVTMPDYRRHWQGALISQTDFSLCFKLMAHYQLKTNQQEVSFTHQALALGLEEVYNLLQRADLKPVHTFQTFSYDAPSLYDGASRYTIVARHK